MTSGYVFLLTSTMGIFFIYRYIVSLSRIYPDITKAGTAMSGRPNGGSLVVCFLFACLVCGNLVPARTRLAQAARMAAYSNMHQIRFDGSLSNELSPFFDPRRATWAISFR